MLVGGLATVLALAVDGGAYEPFLFLIGAVFVPLVGVFVIAYFVLPRGAWNVSADAPARPVMLVPWVAGFVAYQLTLPDLLRRRGLGLDGVLGPAGRPRHRSGQRLSASLVSLAVAARADRSVCLPGQTAWTA